MASVDAGMGAKVGAGQSPCPTATELTAQRQALKDCYCGLGADCCHWEEMTHEGRVDCSRDKRASVDSFWKTGTVS